MRVLSLDVGDKKIGLAVGDTDTKMAFTRPALLVNHWDEVWGPLKEILISDKIEKIVIGWPLNTDGTIGAQVRRVEKFISELSVHSSLPIIKRDERHTSAAVQKEQQQAGIKLSRGQEDSLAAQLLLESYLSEKYEKYD